MKVQIALSAANVVGESIVWDAAHRRLLWVDIIGRAIHAYSPVTGTHRSWTTPDLVTSIGLCKGGGAIVGLRKSLALWDFADEFRVLAEVEGDRPGNRLNEGVVGPDGAFWCGTMQNNIGPDGEPLEISGRSGRLYRFTRTEGLQQVSDDTFGITNTLVWCGADRLVTADTLENTLYSYRIDPRGSSLSDRRDFFSGFPRGLPDGSCQDEQGFIWNCRVAGGGCLVRLSPEGELDRVIDLPCSWPTSCAFGGENLDTLYVTSARFTMTEDHLRQNPHEGALMAVQTGHRGRLPNCFG